MIDFFCIFSTGGLILWYKQMGDFNFDLINMLIRNILMDEKRNQDFYTVDGIVLRWKVINDKGLIFTVSKLILIQAAYQQSFGQLYVDVLIEMVAKDFTNNFLNDVKKINSVYVECPNYSNRYIEVLRKWSNYCDDKLKYIINN